MKKTLMVIGAILLAAAIAGGSFWGGMAYQTGQANQARDRFMNARGLSGDAQLPGGNQPSVQFQGGGPGGQFAGRGTTGVVKTNDGNVLTISTAQDVTTVNLSEETLIEKTVTGEIADLQPGTRVMVIGEKGADGNLTASQITIVSDRMFEGPPNESMPYPSPTGTGQ